MTLEAFATAVQALRPDAYSSVSIERDRYASGRIELTYNAYADGIGVIAKTPEEAVAELTRRLAARAERHPVLA
jgi:hypothetical protein